MGDPDIVTSFLKFRNLAAPQLPFPVQAASAAVWADEEHVTANRALYREKIVAAADILDGVFGFYAPPGGFFLWLDMSECGGGEAAARALWRHEGIRILPGAYLARPEPGASEDPYAKFVRIALVHDLETCTDVLTRMAALFAATA
jgi:aspartate/methionine/tyrosine aminotransferase